jgi:hypothetical protein
MPWVLERIIIAGVHEMSPFLIEVPNTTFILNFKLFLKERVLF